MSTKQRLHELVERIPASRIDAAVELLESLLEAPVDLEMLDRIDETRRERGAGLPHEEVLREFGF
jgi:hypothetical protein